MKDPFTVSSKGSNPEKDRLVVGAHIPRRQAEFLAMYALHRGVPRSHLISEAINLWIDDARIDISSDEIIQSLTSRAIREWQNIVEMQQHDPNWDKEKARTKYIKLITKSLLKRAIPRGVISQIVWKVEERDEKNER